MQVLAKEEMISTSDSKKGLTKGRRRQDAAVMWVRLQDGYSHPPCTGTIRFPGTIRRKGDGEASACSRDMMWKSGDRLFLDQSRRHCAH